MNKLLRLRVILPQIALLVAVVWPTSLFFLWGPVIPENFDPVKYGVAIGSTLGVRLLLYVGICVFFVALRLILGRVGKGELASLVLAGGFLILSYAILKSLNVPFSKYWAAGTAVLVYLNSLPPDVLKRVIEWPAVKVFVFLTPILSEVLLPALLLTWVFSLKKANQRPYSFLAWIGILQGAAIVTVLLPMTYALRIDRALFYDSDVEAFARSDMRALSSGDFAWLALDLPLRRLYVCGNGLRQLVAFDLDHLQNAPLKAPVGNGGAQFCGFNPSASEIYFYSSSEKKLVWLDSRTLQPKHILDFDLPPGEVFILYSKALDWVIFASEDSKYLGNSVHMFERGTARHVQSLGTVPGYAVVHPTEPWLYMDFWRHRNELLRFDLRNPASFVSANTDSRVDRLIFEPKRNEILIASPLRSRVLRYDARTLEAKGFIPTVFGVRTMGLDLKRDLLMTGSLITNEMEVRSLKNNCSLARFRLGPWLREIAVDAEEGTAYVSSLGALYKVHYLNRVEQSVGCTP